MTSINCRVWPSWQHKRDPCGPRGTHSLTCQEYRVQRLYGLGGEENKFWSCRNGISIVSLVATYFTHSSILTHQQETKVWRYMASWSNGCFEVLWIRPLQTPRHKVPLGTYKMWVLSDWILFFWQKAPRSNLADNYNYSWWRGGGLLSSRCRPPTGYYATAVLSSRCY
jgi:hypothetical protein